MKWLRVLFLVVCASGLLLGLYWERHTIHRLDNAEPTVSDGPAFVLGATIDKFMLKDGMLFAVDSLGSESAQAKDCKT